MKIAELEEKLGEDVVKALVDLMLRKADELFRTTGAKLDEKERKELIEGFTKNFEDSHMTTKEVEEHTEKMSKEIVELVDANEKMEKQLKELGIKLEGQKGAGGAQKGERLSLKNAIGAQLEAKEYQEWAQKGIGTSPEMKMQAKDITWTGFDISNGDIVSPQRVGPQVTFVPLEELDVRAIFPGGLTSDSTHEFVKEVGYTDNAGFLTENASSGETTVNLEGARTTSVRLATHVQISKRALKNVDFIQSYVSNRVMEHIKEQLNNGVFNGDGTSDTIDGMFNQAPAFTAGDFATSIQSAQTADLLTVAITRLLQIAQINANTIFLNYVDATKLVLTKDLDDNYLNDIIISRNEAGLLRVNGRPVLETFQVPEDEFLIAAMGPLYAELYQCGEINMWVADQHADTAIQNMVTFIVETEWIFSIYAPFRSLKGVISTDTAAILAV